jgi:2-hydroxychromene-2-carboxylate isomerase
MRGNQSKPGVFVSTGAAMEAYWYFDFASPFSYLQLTKAREWRSRLPVTPVPIAARALPQLPDPSDAQTLGIESSVDGFVRWRAKGAGVPLNFPPTYPFNSFAALRLCVAAGNSWHALETIFDHLWRDGHDGMLPEELKGVGRALGIADPVAAIAAPDTAATIRANTTAARALGVSMVPTVRVGGMLFSGSGASDQMDAWLAQPPALRRTA